MSTVGSQGGSSRLEPWIFHQKGVWAWSVWGDCCSTLRELLKLSGLPLWDGAERVELSHWVVTHIVEGGYLELQSKGRARGRG